MGVPERLGLHGHCISTVRRVARHEDLAESAAADHPFDHVASLAEHVADLQQRLSVPAALQALA